MYGMRSEMQKRDLTVRAYSLNLKTIDKERRSVEAVIATEEPVMVLDMRTWRPIMEVLLMTGARLPNRVPFVNSHRRETIEELIGSTVEMNVQSGKLVGRNIYSEEDIGARAWGKMTEGHLPDNSIGYMVEKYVDIPAGQTKKVKGREWTAPDDMALRITTKWTVRENSAVIIPADVNAKNRNITDIDGRSDLMKFEKWLEERGLKLEDLDKTQRAKLEIDFREFEKRNAKPPDPLPADTDKTGDTGGQRGDAGGTDSGAGEAVTLDAVIKAMDKRDAAQLVARTELDKTIRKEGEGMTDVVITKALACRTIEDAQRMYLEAHRSGRPSGITAPGIIVAEHTVARTHIEAALMLRSGCDGEALIKDKVYNEQVVNQADAMRDISLIDICRHSIQMDGGDVPISRQDVIRAAFSTTSLPQMLGNIAHKSMMRGYMLASDTWRIWCSIGTVTDFKLHTGVRVTQSGAFKEVGNSGEVKHLGLVEEHETNRAKTYAALFGITRHDIIDDNLGAFTQTPLRMGQIAGNDLADLIYYLLMSNPAMVSDSVAMFHADHKNLITSNALGTDGMSASIAAFRVQTDIAGKTISMDPRVVLIPPALETVAKGLWLSDLLRTTGFATSDAVSTLNNVHKSVLDPVVEARLSNATFPNYSTSTWYPMALPSAGAGNVEVVFLNGVQTPVIERFNPGPNYVGGVIFQMYFDAGAAPKDFRGVQKNTA